MRCPFCGHSDTSVKDSRTTDDQAAIKRRRIRIECGSSFTTFERLQMRDLMVIKKNILLLVAIIQIVSMN